MRALTATLVIVLTAACGGLDNAPLTLGLIRGTVIDPTPESIVFVEELPRLNARPGADGRFELAAVPQGDVTLVVLASSSRAERRAVTVGGGAVAEVAGVGATPGVRVELEVQVPSHQRRAGGVIEVGGVTLAQSLNRDGEAYVALPAGCLAVRVTLRGLGSVEKQVCTETTPREVRFAMPPPDGSPGREGCSVTGCDSGFTCQSSGACE